MQSKIYNVPLVLVTNFLFFQIPSQHTIRYGRYYSHLQLLTVFRCTWNAIKMYILILLIISSCTCQCVLTNYGLNSEQKLSNGTVESSWHENSFYFCNLSPSVYSIKIEATVKESQTKYMFTNWLKQLHITAGLKFSSSMCAQKAVET
jgi:hypothetical protein